MPRKAHARAKSRTPLSEERILRCAIELADLSGIESLSMRKIANSLGVEAMSLYNHVANKDEILDGIIELVVGEISVPSGKADWKTKMRRRAISAHEVLLRHPWAAALIESRTTHGPVRLKYADSILGILREARFSTKLAYYAFLTLDSYLYGFTLQEVSWPFGPDELPAVVEKLKPQLPADQYPRIAEMMSFALREHLKGTKRRRAYETEFEFGLDLILDGLERARDRGAK